MGFVIHSSYEWYNEKGYVIPSLEIHGPYNDRDGIQYTNFVLQSSDCLSSSNALKAFGTFRERELIALRDHLNKQFPVTDAVPVYDEEEELKFLKELEELELVADEYSPSYYVDYDAQQDAYVVVEHSFDQLALFKNKEDAEDYAEKLTERHHGS